MGKIKILSASKGKGKTTELVKLSNEKWLYIICRDRQRVDNIVSVANSLGLDIPYPITLRELPLNSRFIDSVLIDDLEDVIESLIGKRIELSTTSCKIEEIV